MNERPTCFRVGRREHGRRLDRFLLARIPGLSRTRIQRAIRQRVSVSWAATARPATRVRAGAEVRIGWTPRVEPLLDLELAVLARGAGWLACDKPAGLPVHPAGRVRDNSVIRMLRRQEGREGLALVHRLDRETTGVLLVAEEAGTARRLSLAFARGRVAKEYLAVVAGVVAEPAGRIDLPIADDPGSRALARRRTGAGKAARTDWRVERRWGDRTLLRVWPHTGRRHQIRVHLAALGHPVLGDPLYGRPDDDWLALVHHGRDVRRERPGPRRQLLHCARLVFDDPSLPDGVRIVVVDAPVPPEFRPELDSARQAPVAREGEVGG